MITPGTRLGFYEVLAPLGAGGMGEVLRARDTRIGRVVALKILPQEVASDPERLRRFEIEARAAGALNHPNLVTIHEFAVENGTPFLVMELLEGETLRERLGDTSAEGSKTRLPIRKALDLSQQLAAGLAAAHDKGIVHRDLKPENIFITRDGRLKILDFGLAKVNGANPGETDATQERHTSPGTILGTAGYMSPEQVRGHDVDHTTDIFACGAILYEMLAGRRAFHGSSAADTMSAILNHDPAEFTSSGQHIPAGVDRVVRRCLEKQRSERFESARDLAWALEAVSSSSTSHEGIAGAPPQGSHAWTARAAVAVIVLLLTAAIALVAYRQGRSSAVRPVASATQLTFDAGVETSATIAPDGRTFVFVRGEVPHRRLYLQRVDGRSPIALSSSADADDYDPAFSPDGSQIAFRSNRNGGGIFVMGATGESVRRLTSSGFEPAWTPDGAQIVFTSEELAAPQSRNSVSSLSVANLATGATRMLFAGDAMQPNVSPHGKRIVYWALPPRGGQRDLYTIAIDGNPKSVVRLTDDKPLDWNPIWSPDGRSILFSSDRGGTMNLWRIAVDEETGKARGAPEPISVPSIRAGWISIARDGRHVLYSSLSMTEELRRGTFDAATEKVTVDPRPVLSGSLLTRDAAASPDGKWIAFCTEARQEDIYVMRADGTDLRQLTNDLDRDRGVSWTPDSSRVVFYSDRSGTYDAWSILVDGSGLQPLSAGVQVNFPIVSPDGKQLAFFDLKSMRVGALGPKPATKFDTLPPLPGSGDSFLGTAWLPDGKGLVGTTWIGRSGLYVYSFASRRYSVIAAETAAATKVAASVNAFAVPIDDHRVLVALADKRLAVADLRSNAMRIIGDLPGTSISRNARVLLAADRHREEDIWLLTLGDDQIH